MTLTDTQARALSIIKAEPDIAGDDLAKRLWPTLRSGQAIAVAGFGLMGRLVKRGWVRKKEGERCLTADGLTLAGRQALAEYVRATCVGESAATSA